MKKALLLWTLFTPLVVASEIKEDLTSSASPSIKRAGERLENWKFSGDFNLSLDHNNPINRSLIITPLFINSDINKISLLGYTNGNYRISIDIEKIGRSFDFKEKLIVMTISLLRFFQQVKLKIIQNF